jgi:hypothetical protein
MGVTLLSAVVMLRCLVDAIHAGLSLVFWAGIPYFEAVELYNQISFFAVMAKVLIDPAINLCACLGIYLAISSVRRRQSVYGRSRDIDNYVALMLMGESVVFLSVLPFCLTLHYWRLVVFHS